MNGESFARALRALETFEAPCAGERTLEVAGVRLRVRLSSPRLADGSLRALAPHAVADDPAVSPDVTLLVLDHDVPGNPVHELLPDAPRTPPVGDRIERWSYDGDAGRGLTGARPAAAAIVADPVLGIVGEVGVPGTVTVLDLAIVLRALVLVADHERDRCAGGDPLEHTRQDLDPVRLLALGRELRLPGLAAVEPVLDLGLRQRQPRRHAVDHDTDGRPVALAPGRKTEQLAEGGPGHQSLTTEMSGASTAFMPTTW